jgi:hypothetical protein
MWAHLISVTNPVMAGNRMIHKAISVVEAKLSMWARWLRPEMLSGVVLELPGEPGDR